MHMSRKIKFGSGSVTVELDDEVASAIQNVVDKVLPKTRREIDKQLAQIEDDARRRWLVREKNSKDSRSKLYSEVVINSQLQLVGNIGNSATYAWAIRSGEDPQQSKLQTGKRISNELLFKPVKKQSDVIAETIADETIKLMK